MTTSTERPVTVLDRLTEAREIFALLVLFTENPPKGEWLNEEMTEWGWYRVNKMCLAGYNAIDAALAALDHEANCAPAPEVRP